MRETRTRRGERMNCPNCQYESDYKPQLIEFEDVDGQTYFRCEKCHKVFELVENDEVKG